MGLSTGSKKTEKILNFAKNEYIGDEKIKGASQDMKDYGSKRLNVN